MNTSSRGKNIFFWTLVALFFVVSTTLIAYAFGYRYSFKQGIFIYAGSITLKTTPQEAQIRINGQQVPGKRLSLINNAYHVGGIRPGEYLVEVSAPDYKAWQKKVTVRSGISTEFWNVQLGRNSYEQTVYDVPGAKRFFISPRKNLIAAVRQAEKGFSLDIIEPEDKTVRSGLFKTTEEFSPEEGENLEWSPQAHRLIIPVRGTDGQKNYYAVNVQDGSASNLMDITASAKMSHVRWDPEERDAFFYMSDQDLYRVELESAAAPELIASSISAYDLSSDGIFYMQSSGIVYRLETDGNGIPQQITTSSLEDMPEGAAELIAYERDRLTLRSASGTLYVYNKSPEGQIRMRKLLTDARGSQFSNDGKKLLYWNDHEMYVYFVRDWETQPQRTADEVMPITRFAEKLRNVQWSQDYEHILFSTGQTLKSVEIDQRDQRDMFDIATFQSSEALATLSSADSKIYLSDTLADGTWIIKSIQLPEETNFLGMRSN